MAKTTRGRGSKIEQLPDAVKSLLNAMLRDQQYTQQDILDEVNTQLEAMGADDEKISRSGLNRYATRMAAIGKKMQERQAAANALTSKLGEVPQGDIGKLLINITQSLAFDILSDAAEGDDPASLGMLKDLSLLIRRLESANMDSLKREKEIRKAFAEEAANHVHDVAVQRGMTKEDAQFWREEVLGMGK
jgi:hypothetical protein